MATDTLDHMRALCATCSTTLLLGTLQTLADQHGPGKTMPRGDALAFAIVANALCERWGLDGPKLAREPRPMVAIRSALLVAGYDGTNDLV